MQLVWLDLETTGLDPRRDVVLELGVRIATLDAPFVWTEERSWVFHYEERKFSFPMAPEVRTMHEKSGLLEECARSANTEKEADKVEEELLALVPYVEDPEERPVLAGFSPHFDMSFLCATNGGASDPFASRLSHRLYDVSAIKLFCRSLGMPKLTKGVASHRAIPDVDESMRHAQQCVIWLSSAGILLPKVRGTLLLADYTKMTDEQRSRALDELMSNPNGDRQFVEDEIRKLEQRYEMTSETMRGRVRSRNIDTADTARWLVLLDALGR